jgi:hypothetical protein
MKLYERVLLTTVVITGTLALLAFCAPVAEATGSHKPPEKPSHVSTATSDSSSAALAGAISGSVAGSTSKSTATGGNANATGGNGGAGGAGGAGGSAFSTSTADGSSSNVYNSTTTVERSVGALIMGTVIPVDCGFGGQAGGSNRNGAGFLGASWTTDKCYTLKAATAWAAMGEYELACEMLVDVTKKALKRRKRSPDCTVIGASLRMQHASVPTPPAPQAQLSPVVIMGESLLRSAPVAPPAYATEDYVREQVDRAFRRSVGK